jgi:diguanylate cyclase
MSTTPPDSATPPTPALLAKAAFKRLATERQEPTPENFRTAYAAESAALGWPMAEAAQPPSAPSLPMAPAAPDGEDGPAWAELIGRIARGLERSNKQWTAARRKDSLQRVLAGSRQSSSRLLQRLQPLVQAWDSDRPEDEQAAAQALDTAVPTAPLEAVAATGTTAVPPAENVAPNAPPDQDEAVSMDASQHDASWLSTPLVETISTALPASDTQAADAQAALQAAVNRALQTQAPQDTAQGELQDACAQARRVIEHRHHVMDQLLELCRSLTDSLVDLAEDDSWAQGQSEAMRAELSEGLTSRGARRIQQLLDDTRQRQQALKGERDAARQALKQLIQQMLSEIGELGHTTGRFQDNLSRYADTIGQADTLESLTGVVREMVTESLAVHGVISQAQERLHTEHTRATELTQRVRDLEDEIRKLSDEVSTDPLTQVANRRGLMRLFESERSRVDRQGQLLAIGLLDVDNFKKLNDTLGHHTGDEALKFLSRRVSESLRPSDALARYGGEEFVVLMPNTHVEEGQQVLTRLQRQLSAEFFTQDTHKVFITFSAGVTQYRGDEPIEQALDRADVALYEAKRTGKNRTCIG